jgi:hypothetical protein
MRIGAFAVLSVALLAYSTDAHAELQLINNGGLSAKAAQLRFAQAWKACSDAQRPGASQAALVKCVNEKLAQYKLQLVE